MTGIALLCVGKSKNDQLNAQTFSPQTRLTDTLNWMFRIYEDNDFINARGCGTDDAYTNGTRFDYFYQPGHLSKNPVDRILPKAGPNSMNIYGWGVMQLMYTPKDITDSAYQPNDYPWAGALIATHTLYSFNPVKKFDRNTRHSRNWQLYFICRPELQFIATEAVLQGGMFTHNPNLTVSSAPAKPQQQPPAPPQPDQPTNNIVFASNFGAVASIGDVSISFNQNSSTAMMKGLYAHEVGNIALYFGW